MQKDGKFDYDCFTRFSQFQLGMSPKAFIDSSGASCWPHRVRNLLRGGVNVSEDEVKARLRAAGQPGEPGVRPLPVPAATRTTVEPTPAEVEAHAKANEAKLKQLYDQRKFLYENSPKERRLRQILVKLDTGASRRRQPRGREEGPGAGRRG